MLFWSLFAIVGLLIVVLTIQDLRRKKARRDTLHQGDNGVYYWVDFDGSECSSTIHPDAPGGAWYSENAASDGGGFDGGGDGGGGGD